MYRLIVKIHMGGEECNNDQHVKNILLVLNIKYGTIEKTKVPDKTEGGREG